MFDVLCRCGRRQFLKLGTSIGMYTSTPVRHPQKSSRSSYSVIFLKLPVILLEMVLPDSSFSVWSIPGNGLSYSIVKFYISLAKNSILLRNAARLIIDVVYNQIHEFQNTYIEISLSITKSGAIIKELKRKREVFLLSRAERYRIQS